MDPVGAALGAAYVLAGVLVVGHTLVQTDLWLAVRRGRSHEPPQPSTSGPLPRLLVQLPVYNEAPVVERLLDAVCAMEYPEGRWAVQVLDDSTDTTGTIVERWVGARDLSAGPPVFHVRRDHREGYKAGALAEGLRQVPWAEVVAVLDADFVPEPTFLLRTATLLDAPDVAVAQARWGHLNEHESWLTRAQAVMIDNHFQVEQQGRQVRSAFSVFNGSAGLLRVSAVHGAGGWRATTLTEDFDLSLRLQLAGWRVVYDASIVVPAELPGTPAALRLQQHRWMRGVAQNARLHLRAVVSVPMPVRIRLHLLAQVLESATFVAMALVLLLAAPVAAAAHAGRLPVLVAMNLPLVVAFVGLVPSYTHSIRLTPGDPGGSLARYGGFVLLSAALTLHNAVAVLSGWTSRAAAFDRTPKAGSPTTADSAVPATADAAVSEAPRRASARLAAEATLAGLVLVGAGWVAVTRPAAALYLWPVLSWVVGSATLALTPASPRQRRWQPSQSRRR